MRDRFSATRIQSPGERLLSMHPFVDVLEGRGLLHASVRGGVMWFNGRPFGAAGAGPQASRGGSDTAGGNGSAGRRALVRVPATTEPAATVAVTSRDGRSVFSELPIDEADATLFANAFHARTGGAEQRSATQLPGGTPPPDVFRRDRALTGPMNPYLTAAARSRTNRRPFAA